MRGRIEARDARDESGFPPRAARKIDWPTERFGRQGFAQSLLHQLDVQGLECVQMQVALREGDR
ncbi:MAG: hypothetical protein MUC91_02790, partial [Verrucomicrobia bacterium]|nr:hypothetical protein [Verrucomicrobiota bacterium]